MNKRLNLIIILIFLIIIFGEAWLNNKNFLTTFDRYNINSEWDSANFNIENEINNNFQSKNKLVNLYGLIQNIFNKDLVGNFDYIKDNKGIIHRFGEEVSANNFIEGMSCLKRIADEKSIPLFYVQIPDRVIDGFTNDSWGVRQTSMEDIINQILESIKEEKIFYLDLREDLKNKEFNYDEFFFRTDIHLTTKAEWYILKKIIYQLNQSGCLFSNQQKILNLDNYEKVTNLFLGNLGRMTGKYFTKLDNFERYYPKFETSYTRTHMLTGEKFDGSFQQIVMNEYPKEGDETTYWVTDYMQFTNPFYNFENHLVDNNTNILIIMDSLGYRTAAYLSLLVKNLSVIDTRYQGNNNMINWALQTYDYDAIIVLQSTFLLNSDFMPKILSNPDADIISTTTPLVVKRGESYEIQIKVRNTGNKTWNAKEQIRLCIFQDGVDYGYRIDLPDGTEVQPGQEYIFIQKNFQAPTNSHTFLEYQMVQEGISYFGEKYYVPIIVEGELDFQSKILSTIFYEKDEKYYVKAEVKNLSNFIWSEQYGIRLAIWDGEVDTGNRGIILNSESVYSGDNYIFVFELNEDYKLSSNLSCQMVFEGITYFGDKVYLKNNKIKDKEDY